MYNFSRLLHMSTKYFSHTLRHQIFRYHFSFLQQQIKNNEWIVYQTHRPSIPLVNIVRTYAKSKDKKKEKGKVKIEINENEMSEVVNLENLKKHLQRPVEILKEEFIKNLSLRSTSGSIENLNVNFDSKDYTLQELGQVVRKNPSLTVVNLSVFPQAIPAVIKAIQKSGMNLNPQQEGTTLYIPVPKITKEYREDLAKSAKQLFIKCRDNIKDAQMQQIKTVKKKQKLSADVIMNVEHQITALAGTYIDEAQTIYNSKYMSKPFKLSCSLVGHSLDVRNVCATADNCIISGSRDKTAKFWKPNGFNTGYVDAVTYNEQKNFVASVLYLPSSKEFPDGLVVTGGNDNTIFIYRPFEHFAMLTLTEHSNTVCCLAKGFDENTFLSASWDTSAKLWSLNNVQHSTVTFSGHLAAVWSVTQLSNSNIATASADKTIALWFKNGQRFQVLTGHTDCVRGLTDFPELNHFASVSNDATIKFWSYAGENIETLYGHTSYIYSIARNKRDGDNCFVTSDEDRSVRYWKDGTNVQTLQLPSQSIWSVCCLQNGDIVTASSDGVIRVFTQDESRYATDTELQAFEEEVNALQQQTSQEIGGVKVSDLPGREALYDPGKRPGQMKMIRESQGVVAYTWVEDGENSHWEKVGDVLGGTDKTNEGKTMYEGEAYDFVFSVDVEDGKPPLKLPYNKGDDPYTAAHIFLSKNMLPAAYLDQVVDFILKNSKTDMPPINADFVDPFTGSSRYTPTASSSAFGQAGTNVDPLTGSTSYSSDMGSTKSSTGGNSSAVPYSLTDAAGKYFPQMKYRSFDMGDPKVILNKLKEFNQKSGDSSSKVDETTLEDIIKLCMQPSSDSKCIDGLFKILLWTDDIVFPVIDVVRLALRNKTNNTIISMKDNGSVMNTLKNCLVESKLQNNIIVTLRALCNFYCHPSGEELIFKNRIELLETVIGVSIQNKNVEVGLATFLMNTTILCQNKEDEIGLFFLANILPDIIAVLTDAEAQFRTIVALGTLLTYGSSSEQKQIKVKVLENEKFIERLKTFCEEGVNDVELKRRKCAQQLDYELRH